MSELEGKKKLSDNEIREYLSLLEMEEEGNHDIDEIEMGDEPDIQFVCPQHIIKTMTIRFPHCRDIEEF